MGPRGHPKGAPPTLIVEFAGPPGAGKTTLSRHVEQILHREGVQAERVHPERIFDVQTVHRKKSLIRRSSAVLRMMLYTGKMTLLRPRVLFYFLRVSRQARSPGGPVFDLTDLVTQLQIHASRMIGMKGLSSRPGVHLCDGGYVTSYCGMQMWDAVQRAPPNDLIEGKISVPYFVVFVSADVATLRTRIETRGHNPRARSVHGRNPGLLQRFMDAWDELTCTGATTGIFTYQTDKREDGSLEETARHVAHRIVDLWNQASKDQRAPPAGP